MKQVVAKVIAKGERLPPLRRLHGRSIEFSQTITLRRAGFATNAKPGQYVMVRCGAECVLPRPFSIHRVINKHDFELYFAVLEDGKGTNWLGQREVGDDVEVFGPLGNNFSISPGSKSLLLVAGGMGVAALTFLAEGAVKKKHSVTLLYGTAVRNPYPKAPQDVEMIRATDNGSMKGYHGFVTDLIPEYAKKADQIFACGPLPMYRAMSQMMELQNKPVQISLEVRMGCGRGVCYGCTVKTKQGLKKVCEDGPVFELSDIMWGELNFSHAV